MSMTNEEMALRFFPHALGGQALRAAVDVSATVTRAATMMDRRLPDGRAKSLALTRLEESLMWACEALAELDDASPEELVCHDDGNGACDQCGEGWDCRDLDGNRYVPDFCPGCGRKVM